MKKVFLLFFTLSSSLFIVPLRAQWEPLNVPSNLTISAIATCNGVLFVGTYYAGIYRSIDNGDHWQQVGNDIKNSGQVYCFAVNGNNLFVATEGNVFLSTDTGTSWAIADNTIPYSGNSASMAVSKGSLFLQTGNGLFRTTNNGGNWTFVDSAFIGWGTYIVGDDTDLYAIGGAHDGFVYRSTDNGISWIKRGKVLPDTQEGVESFLLSNGTLFISSYGDSIYRSTDSGATWTEISNGLSHQANAGFYLFGVIDGKLYASGGYSTNNGDSWDTTNNGFPDGKLAFIGNNIFSGGIGVARSKDRGTSWVPVNTGLLYGTGIYPLAVIGNDIFVGTHDYTSQGANIYRSTDDGVTWTGSIYQVTLNPLTFMSTKGKLFLGTLYGDSPIGVFRSADSGATWVLPNDSLGLGCSDWGQGVTELGAIGSDLYATTCGMGLIRSTDDGKSWTSADSTIPSRIVPPPYAFNENTVFSYFGGSIYKSTDSGQHWEKDTIGIGDQYVNFLIESNGNMFAATDGAVFRSTNNGALWEPADSGLPYDNMISLAVSGDNILVSTDSNGVFLSTNKGESWRNVNAGLKVLSVGYLAICGNYVYINTVTTIYRGSLSKLVTAVNENPIVSTNLQLSQNYPNPFSTTTNVEFRLPNEARVTLNVYNSLGEEVATVANGEMSAGEHSLPFRAEGLQNGIYFYRLTARKFSQTGKMTVVH
jgi:photosystem II stability/assembly factor-like uncharacterized protein